MSEISMLNLGQEREDNRDKILKEFLLTSKKEYETYAPFKRVVDLLLGNIDQVAPLIPAKDNKGIVITKRKDGYKATLADDVNKICKTATEYAISIGDDDLQHAVRFRATDITHAKDGNVAAMITTINDALTPLIGIAAFDEYQITADMLTALTEAAKAFSDTRGKAAVVDTSSTIANGDLNNVFKAIRSNIASLRRLLPHFAKKNPAFVTGFNAAAAVDYSGIRHSGIEGYVTNPLTGEPINGAVITGEGKKKIAKTDKTGYYKLIRLKASDMTITVTADGYDTLTMDVRIVRSRIEVLNFALKGKVLNLSATA